MKLYLRDSTSRDTLQDLDDAFRSVYTPSNAYTVTFLDRTAININATNPSMGQTLADRTVNDSVHPGCNDDNCPEGDPTLLAIVIGTYVGTCRNQNVY